MPKPCLGFPSRTKAAVALEAQGFTDGQIAEKMGVPKRNVGALLASARRSADRETRVPIKKTTESLLMLEATARGLSVNELAVRIIDTVARDGLVNAVLDDERKAV